MVDSLGGSAVVGAGSLVKYGIPPGLFDPTCGFFVELSAFAAIALRTVLLA